MHSKRAVPKRRIPAADLIAAAAVLEGASTAHPVNGTGNLHSPEACEVPGSSAFKLHSYCNSGANGAYRNTESTVQPAKIANHLKDFPARAESVKQAVARAKSA